MFVFIFGSMFVLLKGATKEQAFKIGNEIAEAVTATNPKPVKLKFEKVRNPCTQRSRRSVWMCSLCVCCSDLPALHPAD